MLRDILGYLHSSLNLKFSDKGTNHDFTLEEKINSYIKYIVLLRRDPVCQFEAYYRWSLRREQVNGKCSDRPIWEQKVSEGIPAFVTCLQPHYKKFIKKWTKHGNNRHVMYYEDILNNPASEIMGVMQFLHTGEKFNEKQIKELLDEFPTKIALRYFIDDSTYNKFKEELSSR